MLAQIIPHVLIQGIVGEATKTYSSFAPQIKTVEFL